MSISASESSATLPQSVLEIGVEALPLMNGSLSQRNDHDDGWAPIREDDDHQSSKKADSNRSILTVNASCI